MLSRIDTTDSVHSNRGDRNSYENHNIRTNENHNIRTKHLNVRNHYGQRKRV